MHGEKAQERKCRKPAVQQTTEEEDIYNARSGIFYGFLWMTSCLYNMEHYIKEGDVDDTNLLVPENTYVDLADKFYVYCCGLIVWLITST